MGGQGSGSGSHQWWRSRKKDTVEDCLTIDVNRWMREGILKAGVVLRSCSATWTSSDGQVSSISFDVDMLSTDRPSVRLEYSCGATATKEKEALDYRVYLTATRPRFGGLRWWFLCPISGCGRRVRTLHIAPGGRYFACRQCNDLTYTSCQESHKGDRLLRHMASNLGADFAEVQRIMRPPGKRR
jgi:hypothetical protein